MRFSVVRSRRLAAFLAGLAVAVAGCAGMGSRPDAEIVKDRAQARWNALVAGEVGKAYGYISPTGRAAVSLESYISSVRRGFWKAATVESVECVSTEVCEVQATIEYAARGARTRTPLKEKWVKDGSVWWYVQQ